MIKNAARLVLILGLASSISLPTYARGGFGGGGFGRGGFGGGGFSHAGGFGGAGREFGSGHAYGGAGHEYGGGGFGGTTTHPTYGGGFSGANGDKPISANHPNYAAGGEGAFGHQGQYPNHSQFPTDGGFGNATGNRVPQNYDKNNLSGNNINNINHGNFNNDTFNRNVNYNNVNAYGYHGNHPNYGYGGYHPYGGYGYHPYGGYGYHPYGYGWGAYNPEAMMWTYAGVTSLTTLTSFLGMSALMGASGSKNQQPASYSNVTYNGGNVYIDGQAAGTSDQFYKQAQQLAASAYNTPYTTAPSAVTNASYPGMPAAGAIAPGMPVASASVAGAASAAVPTAAPAAGEWKSLGTFSLAEPGQKQSNMMLQLDINPQGVLHGTYYNQLTMETSQVYGALDKEKQRVSWTLGTNPSTVFDAGLGDLVKNESSVLVHYSPSNTQRMDLIRLEHPPANVTGQPDQGAPGQQPQS
jgi:hypothetical protein